MKHVSFRGVEVSTVVLSVLATGYSTNTTADETVTFNDPTSLAALSYREARGRIVKSARFTFVLEGRPPAAYVENCAVISEGVTPPDPALGPIPQGHYHLMYEDPAINNSLDAQQQLPDPENRPRYLMPMCPGAVIQMTYEPNGVPEPFTLKSIQVLNGSLNVGIKSNRFGIGVYNNLTGGFTWSLADGDNITRATFELPRDARQCGGFAIDNIVFEPFAGAPLCASRDDPQVQFSQASPPFADSAMVTFENAEFAPPPEIDIRPFVSTNDINPESEELLAVAVITTEGFDATTVDPSTLEFGPDKAREADQQADMVDVDEDGDIDLLFHFLIPETGVGCSDVALSLAGQTFDGRALEGTDFISTRCEDDRASN